MQRKSSDSLETGVEKGIIEALKRARKESDLFFLFWGEDPLISGQRHSRRQWGCKRLGAVVRVNMVTHEIYLMEHSRSPR